MFYTLEKSHSTKHAPNSQGNCFFGSRRDAVKNPIPFYSNLHREYGDVVRVRSGPGSYWYLIVHPDGVERVLLTNQLNYLKGKSFDRAFSLLTGRGLVTSEGDFWRRQRRLAQPAFHHQLIASYARLVTRATEAMLDRWGAYAFSGEVFDISAEMYSLSLRIAGQSLFGIDLSEKAGEFEPALRVVLEQVNHHLLHRFALPVVLPTSKNKRFNRAKMFIDKVVSEIITHRRNRVTDGNDLLSMLMLARDEETGERMTDKQLHDEVLTFLVGAHESGAAALSWTWYLLAQHPQVIEKLSAELDKILDGRVPSVEDLSNLPYTRMVFEEALRLYPPAWRHQRESINADEIGGYAIPAKSTVVICQYLTQRHPEFWQEPEKFVPERFTPELTRTRHKFAYFPFGGGARHCIGGNFAMMEAHMIIATIAQRYIPKLEQHHKVEIDSTFTLRPRNGVLVSLKQKTSRIFNQLL